MSVGLLKDLKDGKITGSIYFHFFAVNYEKTLKLWKYVKN